MLTSVNKLLKENCNKVNKMRFFLGNKKIQHDNVSLSFVLTFFPFFLRNSVFDTVCDKESDIPLFVNFIKSNTYIQSI